MVVKKVVVRLGQSNQEGRAIYTDLPASLKGPQADTYIWQRVAAAVQQLDGSTGNNRSFPPSGAGLHGPEFTACAAAVVEWGEVYCYKYAIDGTSLGPGSTLFWHPNQVYTPTGTDNMFEYFKADFVDFVTAMGVLGHTVDVQYVSWFQGESDTVYNGLDEAYYGSLKYFISQVRAFLANYTTATVIPWVTHLIHQGIIPSGFTYLIPRVKNVRAAQRKVGTNDRYYRIVDTSDYPHFDDLHLNSAGSQAAGTDEFAAYLLPNSNA